MDVKDGHQRGLTNMVYKFFDKKIGSVVNVNEVLAQKLHKPDNIFAADLAEMISLPSFNCGVKYLLCNKDILTRNTWVKSLADKKFKTALDGFVGIVNEFKCKPNKLWVD